MEQASTKAIVEELYASANERVLEISGDSKTSHFALLRLTCQNKEEFVEWLRNHQSMTGVTFRVKNVRPFKGKTIVYKAGFRCQHNTYPDSHKSRNYKPSEKHTGCESSLKVTIKSAVKGRRVRSQDELRGDFPTIVQVNHNHNHDIKVEDQTKKKRSRKKSSMLFSCASADTTFGSSTLEVEEVFPVSRRENSSPTTATDLYQLSDICGQPEEPCAGTWLTESASDNICFISQDGEVCYNWMDAQTIITNVTTAISSIMKSRFISSPSEVMEAVKSFQDGAKSLETESEFLAALHSFGRTPHSSVDPKTHDSVESTIRGRSTKRKVENCYTSPDGTTYEIMW